MAFGLGRNVLRDRSGTGSGAGSDRVTYVELFFDLVFVFAFTQLGSYLYEHQTPTGALEGAIMVCALWWTWVSTTWVTNWLDPVRLPVRIAVITLALVAFVMSVSIGQAFGDRAYGFAVAYVVLQLARTGFIVWATVRHDRRAAHDFTSVFAWTALACALWVGGALLPQPLQLPVWILALGVELLGTVVGYPLPGRRRVEIAAWDLSGPHIAERTSLFVLIALGEGLLVTGFEVAAKETSVEVVVAFVTAFVAAAACWWIYFDHGERVGAEAIEASETPGRLARTAYTWVHLLVIAGIVLLGVGDKEVLGHPHEQSVAAVVTVLGGPVLFLVGTALFRRVIDRRWPPAHLWGLAGLAVVLAVTPWLDAIATAVASVAVLVATAVGETIVRWRQGRRAGG
ncbi:low temperature requirement protein A [Agromyces sp. LHK192]|uniref:low temperature requirement protein A n=1 Tax=Agromyces sp. LHK192 TaxID=2498704 RepID=UPI000FDB03F5|nr:low temperature requirement protein A [Agromyces sp. LHK192]